LLPPFARALWVTCAEPPRRREANRALAKMSLKEEDCVANVEGARLLL